MEMNLGPIHLLKPLASEVYIRRNKQYSFKTSKRGLFKSQYKLKDARLGAAVKAVRDREEADSRIPRKFWMGELF